jgi:SAM-dependent methyltransferase
MTTLAPVAPDSVVLSYESLAPHYDAFTASYDYEAWLTALEVLAREHGLSGNRILDVGCGTGKSFLPMLARGYEVTACDISPAMVEAALAKIASGEAEVVVADMRRLPALGEFDLITCLDDSVNYLLDEGDLVAALASMGGCLAPDGLLVFDCNTALAYRTAFRSEFVREADDVFFSWRGMGSVENGLARATIDVFSRSAAWWERTTSEHAQRHYPRGVVEAALRDAGLELVAARGQSPGARLEDEVDEERHTKVVYLARLARSSSSERGWARDPGPVVES